VTFDSNSGGAGGALFLGGLGLSFTIYNSTFTGNGNMAGIGGALFVFAGALVSAVNDTFAGNSAATGASVIAFGNQSTFATQNSIFANPQRGSGNCANISGTLVDNGNNLEDTSPSSCGFTAADGDIVGQSPQLASALADNGNAVATAGGPPQTLALSSTSPALHAASASGCATVGSIDERSMPRPGQDGTACDIGAFELQFHTLSVTVKGSGSGTVNGGGIACSGTCSTTYPEGTQVSLSAQPAVGSSFAGWGGDCTGQAGCGVTMNIDHSVSATFTHSVSPPVVVGHTLSVSVSGSGRVTGGGVSCPGVCSKTYATGAEVSLDAKPATGYSFSGWSGDCSAKSSCSVTMSSDRSVTATFMRTTFTRKRLRLAVRPGRAHAGTMICFRFSVTSGASAIRGAKIHFAGKTATSSRHGHAQICAALPPGVHQARATKPHYRPAVRGVRITRPPRPTFTG
jgi:hypothetical protein